MAVPRPDDAGALRLVAVTNLFPNPAEPQRSTFNERQLLALNAIAPLSVVAPVAWTQKLHLARQGRLRELAACREWRGIPVAYPTYWFVPRMLAGIRGASMGASIAAATARAIRERRPQALLATWAYPDGFAAVRLGRRARLPVFVKVHGSDVESLDEGGPQARLALEGLGQARAVVSVSRYLRERLVAHGVPADRIVVVRNGVDADQFRPGDREGLRRELGLDPARSLVIYVGNLKADKGVLDLVDDAVIAACRRRGVHLAIIGGGPLAARLAADVASRSIADTVSLHGRLPPARIALWMGAADALCLPSHHEGIPNVILEAHASGLPVIATNVGGIPEVMSPASGILVEPRQPGQVAAAIDTLLARAWDRQAVRAALTAPTWAQSAAALAQAITERLD